MLTSNRNTPSKDFQRFPIPISKNASNFESRDGISFLYRDCKGTLAVPADWPKGLDWMETKICIMKRIFLPTKLQANTWHCLSL